MEEWAAEKGYDQLLNLKEETEEFIEYWSMGEGLGERRKNWLMVWRTRMKERYERLTALQRRGGYTAGNGGKGDESTKFERGVIRAGREIAALRVEQSGAGRNGSEIADHQGANLFRLPGPPADP
jgi:hypothetical protein